MPALCYGQTLKIKTSQAHGLGMVRPVYIVISAVPCQGGNVSNVDQELSNLKIGAGFKETSAAICLFRIY
jgi:hypothetical protein